MKSFQSRLSSAAFLLALASAPSTAFSQECEARDPTTAEVNSREAVRLAKNGEYKSAAALFRMAIQLDECDPSYRLLYARTLKRSEQFDEAITIYDEVITKFPGTAEAERAQVERNEAVSAAQAAKQKQLAKEAEALTGEGSDLAQKSSGFKHWQPVGWATAGVGVLGIALGAIFALNSQSYQDDLDDQTYDGDKSKYDALVDDRDFSSTMAWISYGVGGTALLGGLFMALVMPKLSDKSSSVSFVPTPNGAAFGFTF